MEIISSYYTPYTGDPIRRNRVIGLFSRRNLEKSVTFWRITETGILPETEIVYFDGHLTDNLKYLKRKSDIIPLGTPLIYSLEFPSR